MKQDRIRYRDIMDLGFKEEEYIDSVYFDEYGYPYTIITKKLTKRVHLDWSKETQLCKMVRVDKEYNIKGEMPIKDLDQLKEFVEFFCGKNKTTEERIADIENGYC